MKGIDLGDDLGELQSDLLEILARRWRLIGLIAVVLAASALVIVLLMPKKYDARCTIFARSRPGALASLSLQLPNLSGGLLTQGGSSADYLAAVLKSDAHAARVANALRLRERPEFARKRGRKPSDYQIIEKLSRSVSVSDDRRGSLKIRAVSRSPALAARIANEYAAQLRGAVTTTNRKRREFISRQLEDTEHKLDKATEELREFQDETGAISLDEQTKAAIAALADLQGQLTAAQVEQREVESGSRTGGSPAQLAQLKSRKAALDSRIQYLEGATADYESKLAELPGVAMRLANLTRDVQVQQKIFEVMNEQYYMASIAEESEDEIFEVVDPAIPAERPCAPRKSAGLAVGGLLGILVGCGLAIRSERRRKKPFVELPEPASASALDIDR